MPATLQLAARLQLKKGQQYAELPKRLEFMLYLIRSLARLYTSLRSRFPTATTAIIN